MHKKTFILPLTLCLPFILFGCTGDDVAGEDVSGSDTTSDSGDGDGDGDGDSGDGDGDPGDGDGDSGDGDGDGDGDSGDGDGDTTGDGDGDAGYCAMGCEEDSDCCPMGSLDCPSDNYPNNWSCSAQGVCEFGGCANDDDCGGLLQSQECHPIGDLPTCFEPCANDADCALQPGTTCSGVADDDVKYCAPEPAPACEGDADCGGYGICNVESGECYCEQDGNCTAEGADTCVLN
ncbi:Endo-1,4-beta-xylanase A precursor [Enhygromyxa salina]|uniref:Endo-1,4-beta-xylanase A n=1 Tax=Enhygromyxa salina TaxID=215803 RepID=A0A0C1Z9Q9_9BACT|nr:hypothetical protein [Enhygromyxa salina]KIG14309.1 Endo-1,4-beta-xylanase A precursor [Enhygromyxa salina]